MTARQSEDDAVDAFSGSAVLSRSAFRSERFISTPAMLRLLRRIRDFSFNGGTSVFFEPSSSGGIAIWRLGLGGAKVTGGSDLRFAELMTEGVCDSVFSEAFVVEEKKLHEDLRRM